ncbi:uncharacterized protein LOC120427713 isoform X1 [Culex pipiens pallens]|uniref:uncharacterized protein LOC120427713 isoform X1 n=2 Tax=Culex pipiens pallens TaxID=42434 RepID=UPI0022AA6841|nr:uncharacterized protein LOC120427713 isoform X1 [Culex pipiens pallens]
MFVIISRIQKGKLQFFDFFIKTYYKQAPREETSNAIFPFLLLFSCVPLKKNLFVTLSLTVSWAFFCMEFCVPSHLRISLKEFVTVNSVYLKPSAIPSKRIKRIAQNPRKLNRSTATEVQASGSAQAESKPKSNCMCSVFNCTSRSGNGIFLHSFPPKSDDRYVIWMHNLRQGKRPSSNYKVCNKHFTPSDYTKGGKRLLNSAIPSVNLPNGTNSEHSDNPYEKPRKSYRVPKPICNSPPVDSSLPVDQSQTHNDTSDRFEQDQLPINDTSDQFEQDLPAQGGQNEQESNHVSASGSATVSVALCEVEPKAKPRVANYFSDLLINDHAVNVWTGVETLELLEQICINTKLLEDAVYSSNHSMHCADRVILVLCKLKQNLSFSALAVLFRVHVSTVSRYFAFTSHVLAELMSKFIQFTPKEEILQNIPLCFRGRFSNVTLVLDCTEVPLCTMNCLNCRISTYSQYKSRHTAKFLVGVTPAGLISFCGRAYSGKSSDKFIFNEENVINLLTPHIDEIMCDKGFSIDNELSVRGITLHIPPFLRAPKLTPSEAEINEGIAEARIHVERIMARLKNFTILCDTIEHCIVGNLDDVMTIVCALVNLSKPILKDDKF